MELLKKIFMTVEKVKSRAIIYAPNIHTGGGKVLLDELLLSLPENFHLVAFLDKRAKDSFILPDNIEVFWVTSNANSRLLAELNLKKVSRDDDFVLLFHGLPPLLPIKGTVAVYLQNMNYIGDINLKSFPFKVSVRIALERFISSFFSYRVDRYIVQTASMSRALTNFFQKKRSKSITAIDIFPFFSGVSKNNTNSDEKIYDFLYIADGIAHKNHQNLLEAWIKLAELGEYPTLALTLGERDKKLIGLVNTLKQKYNLKIINLGHLPYKEVLNLYQCSRALIFPSVTESFGLPLIEASQLGVDIIASELDYVRDVCCPKFTFDPNSSVSIYRAVLRYLGVEEEIPSLNNGADLWYKFVSK